MEKRGEEKEREREGEGGGGGEGGDDLWVRHMCYEARTQCS